MKACFPSTCPACLFDVEAVSTALKGPYVAWAWWVDRNFLWGHSFIPILLLTFISSNPLFWPQLVIPRVTSVSEFRGHESYGVLCPGAWAAHLNSDLKGVGSSAELGAPPLGFSAPERSL